MAVRGTRYVLLKRHAVIKTGGVVRNPKTGATVTVYRIEGTPNTRVLIGEKGQVTITVDTTLYLNFGDKARAQEFLQKTYFAKHGRGYGKNI